MISAKSLISAKSILLRLTLAFMLCAATSAARANDTGLITKPSKNSVQDTVNYFEQAIKQKAGMGFVFFTVIDHADAAKKAGLTMRPRILLIFGNPRVG